MVDKLFAGISFSSSFYNENIDLYLRRYPVHTFSIPRRKEVFSKEKRYLNADILEKHRGWVKSLKNIENNEIFYVYGLGTGVLYLFLKNWLKKDRSKNLVFFEDDADLFSSFLASSLAKEMLSNPSVHIFFRLPSENEKIFFDRCVSNFFSGKIEVVASFSVTKKQKKNFDAVRSYILRSATYYRASHIDDLYSYLNFFHFYKNIEKLPQSFHLNSLKDTFKGVPAVICGAGPSLYQEKEHLKKILNRALIIAGGSAITALLSYGIKPHLGVVLDPNVEEGKRMKHAKHINIPIAYSTRVHSEVFKYFKGPLGYISSVGGGLEALFLEDKLNIKKDFVIGQNLSRDALSVSTINLEIAFFLGCSPIVLCGIDLSYKNNKRYSHGVVKTDNKVIVKEDDPGDVLLKNEKILTSMKWVMEGDVISSYKKEHGIDLINTSMKGLKLDGVKCCFFKEVVKTFEKDIDIGSLLENHFKTAQLGVSTEDINNLKIELKQSLINSKNLISKIKDEVKSLKKTKSEKQSTPLMILYQRELEEELAYKYFLSRPKKAICSHLENFYKSSSVNHSSENKINQLLDFWDTFEKISIRYTESLD